ncbi:hypothetical protein CO058_00015 [candidate division WWE3 bacterium CG_4_9_14_0_2_um_filter_35_11]|uniref:Uncharacterized protein n=1 Tax=candidate division WWE3 bacterium CG_4_9_14_0_2_um_filter_35_11 TaxID=1975077 RepID=A0A2M8EMY1_UNCKA|nr:MAG: hypothetical protein COV25_00015 [candidate division WWE3 bacterium CG10_big_fil_rev_8_21_14_0_10_35_32]PJC24071.1 MAG: hypothetical protein CO058_00015 [candidate division WWE3 bacterium CG_4_9_14_0_2_um_filter_35_11]
MKFLLLIAIVLSLFAVSGYIAPTAYAAAAPCIVDWDPTPPAYVDLGDYLSCAIPRVFSAFRTILVAIAIIFTLLLTYKMLTNTSNSKVMEEIPTRWLYLMIFVILIVGGGSALNIILKFFGFGGVDTWIQILSDMIDKL